MRRFRAGAGLFLVLLWTSACDGNDTERAARPDTARSISPAALPVESVGAPVDDGPGETDPAAGGPSAPSSGSAPDGAAQRVPSPATTPPASSDSAAQILERAAARYRDLRSLQADFTMRMENPLLRSSATSAGVLYQKRPDRLLLRFSDPAGDVIVSDGEYFWVYYPSVNDEQVMRSPASAGGSTGVDLQAQFLGDPTARFRYTLEGRENVGGRPAWRMLLVPRERAGYRSLRVWLDREDQLARRFEITEDNGTVRTFELRNVRENPALADALFRFEVPSGARVIAP